jgi:predicted unusual protein kinase regulating ubiquinone biosynthesis (AarF/ABC1/UbiB family)
MIIYSGEIIGKGEMVRQMSHQQVMNGKMDVEQALQELLRFMEPIVDRLQERSMTVDRIIDLYKNMQARAHSHFFITDGIFCRNTLQSQYIYASGLVSMADVDK